jgi:hypothetical protein
MWRWAGVSAQSKNGPRSLVFIIGSQISQRRTLSTNILIKFASYCDNSRISKDNFQAMRVQSWELFCFISNFCLVCVPYERKKQCLVKVPNAQNQQLPWVPRLLILGCATIQCFLCCLYASVSTLYALCKKFFSYSI